MTNRINSIDILRGFAIIFMIQIHIYKLWTRMNYGFAVLIIEFIGALAAPFFLIFSGSSFFLFINKKISEKISKKKIFSEISKRSLFIFVISLLIQVFFGFLLGMHIFFIIYWSIFQVIAFSMIIFSVLLFLKRNFRIIVMFSSIFLIFLADYIIGYYKIEIFYILVSGGDFPYIRYASFYVFGIVLGDLIINTPIDKFKKLLIITLSTGIFLLILWFFWISQLLIDSFILLFYATFSTLFILFPLIYYFTDINESESFFQETLTHWGKFSFSIYYIQFGVIAAGVIIFPLIISDIYSNGFLFYQYLILLVLIYIGIDIFLRIWKKFDYIFGIEWFLNLISKKSLFLKIEN